MSNKKTILIVEDEKPMLQILSDRLGLEGYEVLTAEDGQEGLHLALANKPDLIVLDIIMPKMNGAEMAQELQKDEWGRAVPIVCLTNVEEVPKSIKELVESGMPITYTVKVHSRLDEVVEAITKRLAS